MSTGSSELTPPTLKRSDALDEPAWKTLLKRISLQKCTPFLGPETCFEFSIPSASSIAEEWSDKYGYPFEDRTNLPRVAQYLAYDVYNNDTGAVKDELVDLFRPLKSPDFSDPDEPHRVLANLPLKVYINTHYFGFMTAALKARLKDPRRAVCPWYRFGESRGGLDPGYDPTPANPLVYHLLGHTDEPQSLVLTEDDYLDFLVRNSKDSLLPGPVEDAMVNNSLLFLGYQMTDLDFRVLLRSLNSLWLNRGRASGSTKHLSVQMVHVGDSTATSDRVARMKQYCKRSCTTLSIDVYWGSTRDFMTELRQRWEDYDAKHSLA